MGGMSVAATLPSTLCEQCEPFEVVLEAAPKRQHISLTCSCQPIGVLVGSVKSR